MSRALLAITLFGLLAGATAWGQASPTQGPHNGALNPQSTQPHDDLPLADYLGLLRHIAPAAEDGAKDYLAAFARRCGRALTAIELRRAISDGDGDPVLMGLIRASHLRDSTAREQLVGHIRCPAGGAR